MAQVLAEHMDAAAGYLLNLQGQPCFQQALDEQRQALCVALRGARLAIADKSMLISKVQTGPWLPADKEALTTAIVSAGVGGALRAALQDFTALPNYGTKTFWTTLGCPMPGTESHKIHHVTSLASALGGVNLSEPSYAVLTAMFLVGSQGPHKTLAMDTPYLQSVLQLVKKSLRATRRIQPAGLQLLPYHPQEFAMSHPETHNSVFCQELPIGNPFGLALDEVVLKIKCRRASTQRQADDMQTMMAMMLKQCMGNFGPASPSPASADELPPWLRLTGRGQSQSPEESPLAALRTPTRAMPPPQAALQESVFATSPETAVPPGAGALVLAAVPPAAGALVLEAVPPGAGALVLAAGPPGAAAPAPPGEDVAMVPATRPQIHSTALVEMQNHKRKSVEGTVETIMKALSCKGSGAAAKEKKGRTKKTKGAPTTAKDVKPMKASKAAKALGGLWTIRCEATRSQFVARCGHGPGSTKTIKYGNGVTMKEAEAKLKKLCKMT